MPPKPVRPRFTTLTDTQTVYSWFSVHLADIGTFTRAQPEPATVIPDLTQNYQNTRCLHTGEL
jgi:hypothetical protein